ncbi:MAG TPA: PIG-L family deacetylase, partial [Candidatus Eisenbacteria bacterium]
RRGEALAALACLGVSPWQTAFLGYPDQGIHGLLMAGDDDLDHALAGEIERFRPTLLVSPSPSDLQPDHSALAVFLSFALARLEPATHPPREARFVVHHDGPIAVTGGAERLALTHEERERKRRAILCHASQLVLRRRALLGFAEDAELFFAPAGASERWGGHPVRHAGVEGDALVLELARRTRPGAFGASDLLLAVAGAGGRRALIARLPRRPGRFELFERQSGTLLARGESRRDHAQGPELVTLPAKVLAGASQAFVKLERRFGFFDEAGWCALPCHVTEASAARTRSVFRSPRTAHAPAPVRPAPRDPE